MRFTDSLLNVFYDFRHPCPRQKRVNGDRENKSESERVGATWLPKAVEVETGLME